MAAVAVSFDATRIEDAETTTGWTNIGGGGGISVEGDIVWQNVGAASRKISTNYYGRGFLDGSQWDFSTGVGPHEVWIAKTTVTNPAALLSRGSPSHTLRIGNSSTVYHDYDVSGNDTYPAIGGWLLLPIDPNLSGYQDGTNGTPTYTDIDYFAVLSDFSTGSKAENVVIDAIDYGTGIHLVGGDGGDTDGVFQDFVDADEGQISTGRYGFVTSQEGILLVHGGMIIGETVTPTATATVFQDTGSVVVFQNGRVNSGWYKLRINLDGTGTDIDFIRCVFIGRGEASNTLDGFYTATGYDTRPILEVTGTTGTLVADGCSFDNFSTFSLNSSCSLLNCVVTNSDQIDTGSGATLSDTSVSGYTGAIGTAAVLWDVNLDPDGELDNMIFDKGAGTTHAIEFGSSVPSSITLTGHSYTGYNVSNGQNDSTIYNNTGGALTVSISDGDGPSYRNGAGASTTIQNAVTLTVKCQDQADDPIESVRVRIQETDGTLIADGSTNASGIYSDSTYNFTVPTPIEVVARKSSSADDPRYYNVVVTGTIINTGFSVSITMAEDGIAS